MARIVLEQVTKVFSGGETVAVDNVSIEIGDGEFMVLVGPSGCGKSTLLRIVAGLEDLTNGEVMIGDRIVTDLAPKDRDIAMVFQNYALYPHMTVRKNLGIGLKLRRTPKPEIDEEGGEVAEILGLERLLERKPAQLSGGQRQRVAHRPGDGARAAGVPDGRAAVEPRRQAAGADARRARAAARPAAHHHHLRDPRPGRGDDARRPGRGHARRRRAAAGHPGGAVPAPRQPVRGRVHRLPLDEPVRGPDQRSRGDFGAHRLPIHADHDLRAYDGKTVILGMRPSDFEDAAVWRDESRPTMDVNVDMAEELGSEVNLIFTLDAKPIETALEAQAADDSGDGAFVPLAPTDATVCTAVRRRAHVRPARQPGPADVRPCPAVLLRSRVRPGDRYRAASVRAWPPGRICSRLRGGSGCRCRRPIGGRA